MAALTARVESAPCYPTTNPQIVEREIRALTVSLSRLHPAASTKCEPQGVPLGELRPAAPAGPGGAATQEQRQLQGEAGPTGAELGRQQQEQQQQPIDRQEHRQQGSSTQACEEEEEGQELQERSTL